MVTSISVTIRSFDLSFAELFAPIVPPERSPLASRFPISICAAISFPYLLNKWLVLTFCILLYNGRSAFGPRESVWLSRHHLPAISVRSPRGSFDSLKRVYKLK